MKKYLMISAAAMIILTMVGCGTGIVNENRANQETALMPTGYSTGEVQRITVYYKDTFYWYTANGFDQPLEEGYIKVGKVEKVDDQEYIKEEFSGTRLDVGQEIYASPKDTSKIYVKYSDGYAMFEAQDPEVLEENGIIINTDKNTEDNNAMSEVYENSVLRELSYYLELACPGKKFMDMDPGQADILLTEYGDLFDNCNLLMRVSSDDEASYIIGHYQDLIEDNPLTLLHSMSFSLAGMEDSFHLLYEERDSERINEALAASKMPDAGYILAKSRIRYSADRGIFIIQPEDAKMSLDDIFYKYIRPGGRDYIEDAVSRGISIYTPQEPYIEFFYISEVYGELREMISLTDEEADIMLNEETITLPKGAGFASTLHANGEMEHFMDFKQNVPQSVLDLAVEKCGYHFITADDITGFITKAQLDCDWLEEPLYASEDDLNRLQEILCSAEPGSVGGCGYGAKLTITCSDGKDFVLFKGCDGCDSMVFGSYGGYYIGDQENRQFWEIFGLDPETKEPLTVFSPS